MYMSEVVEAADEKHTEVRLQIRLSYRNHRVIVLNLTLLLFFVASLSSCAAMARNVISLQASNQQHTSLTHLTTPNIAQEQMSSRRLQNEHYNRVET